jgi:uncharacterized membrane protein
VWEAVRWLHLVAMAFFVGGQLFLVVAVVPVLRGDADRERLRAVARHFGYGTLVALGVLIVTGMQMASHYDDWGETALRVKLGLVALVGALVAWHIAKPHDHALDAAIFVLSLAIVWLGMAVAH